MLRRLYSSSPASGPLKLYLFSLVCSTYNFEQQRASVALCFLLACVIQCPLLFTSCLELIVLSFTRSPVPAPAPTSPVPCALCLGPCALCIVPHAGAFYHACCACAFAFCLQMMPCVLCRIPCALRRMCRRRRPQPATVAPVPCALCLQLVPK